jgi:hypothetical protein
VASAFSGESRISAKNRRSLYISRSNHIHSVWRDFNGDFGGDLLKAHYENSHQDQKG